MGNQRRSSNQRRNSPQTPVGKLHAGERSSTDRFSRWLIIILALHVVAVVIFLVRMRSPGSESGVDVAAAEPPPTERPEDPRAQAKFFDLVKQNPERLPVLPARRNPTDASSDIVLPDQNQLAELQKQEQASLKRETEAKERLENIRRERERLEAEAEAKRQREIAMEKERLRKQREAEERIKAEKLAAEKREQERIARQKAAAKAKAEAEAKAQAVAKAKAERLAAQQRAESSSNGTGSSSGGNSGTGPTADMGWYNNAVLGPAFFSAWNQPAGPDYTGKNFSTSVRITVRKDGRVIKAEIIRSSGNADVDASVRAALDRVTQLAPLPRGYRQSTYSETINFTLDS